MKMHEIPQNIKMPLKVHSSHSLQIRAKHFFNKAHEIFPDWDFSETDFISTKIKVFCRCPQGHEISRAPTDILKGQGCRLCSGQLVSTEIWVAKARKLFPVLIFDKVKYKTNKDNIIIECPIHGIFTIRPDNFKGCPSCNIEQKRIEREKLKVKPLVIHDGHVKEYLYLKHKAIEWKEKIGLDVVKYERSGRIYFICPQHGLQYKTIGQLNKKGQYCGTCKVEEVLSVRKLDSISRLEGLMPNLHPNLRIVNISQYENQLSRLDIECTIHGIYQSTQTNLVHNMSGCPRCQNKDLRYFYIIKDEQQRIIKVGITGKPDVFSRIKDIRSETKLIPYIFLDIGHINQICLEREILQKFKEEYSVYNLAVKNGNTEFFYQEQLPEIMDYIGYFLLE